ncbi:MAG: hypothetical protein E4G93_04635 [Dehalococcoidia bacterium]|nr:MAG: hypothetical protein E4G93_04635 [Dehalococcoidia bacterium]
MFGIGHHTVATVKKLSPRDAMALQIEAVERGKEIVFRLGEIYIKPFITVAHNTEYPVKGKKFVVFQEAAGADNNPGGKRGKFWDTSNSKDIAKWVLEREGHVYQS